MYLMDAIGTALVTSSAMFILFVLPVLIYKLLTGRGPKKEDIAWQEQQKRKWDRLWQEESARQESFSENKNE